MAWIPDTDPAAQPDPQYPSGAPEADPFNKPTAPPLTSTIAAEFRQESPFASLYNITTNAKIGGTFDPSYNPADTLRGTPHEQDDFKIYAGSPSEAYTRRLMDQKDQTDNDRKTIEQSGWAGTVAGIGVGAINPLYYIPIIGYGGAATALGKAAATAATGALSAGLSEGVMHAGQVDRSWQESAGNVASATLLSGILGGAVGSLSKTELASSVRALDDARPRVDGATGAYVPSPQALPPAAIAARQQEVKGALGTLTEKELASSVKPLDDLDSIGGAPPTAPQLDQFDKPQKPPVISGPQGTHAPEELPGEEPHGGYLQSEPAMATGWSPERRDKYFKNQDIAENQGKVAAALGEAGIPKADSDAYMGAAGRLLSEGKETDPWSAYERAVMERHGQDEHLNEGGVFDQGAFGEPSRMFSPGMLSAAATDTRQLQLKGAFGLEKLKVSPELYIYGSQGVEAKRALKDIADTGLQFKGDATGQVAPFGPPLENVKKVIKNNALAETDDIIASSWKDHYWAGSPPGAAKQALAKQGIGAAPAADRLGYSDFDKAVGLAMHNGDTHAIPEVQKAAQQLRSRLIDPVSKMAEETNGPDGQPMLDPARGPPAGAKSFFPLMFDRDKITADYDGARNLFTNALERDQAIKADAQPRLQSLSDELGAAVKKGDTAAQRDVIGRIEGELKQWPGNTAREALRAIKTRDENLAANSTAGTLPAGTAVAKAVNKILASDQTLSRQELRSTAQQWVDRVIGSPQGRLDYDLQSGGSFGGFKGGDEARGSLKERKTWIDVNELADRGYINTSAKQGVASLYRTVLPDTLLTKRFGDAEMTDTFKRINEEYAAKAIPGEDTTKLFKERDQVISKLAAVRDRLRNVNGWDVSPQSRKAASVIRDFQNYNALRQLGTSWIVRLTDLTNGTFRHGLSTTFKDSWVPFVQSLMDPQFRGILRDQAADAAVGTDGLLGHMGHNLNDVIDSEPQNRFSRTLAWSADKSMMLNFHGPLTDAAKTMAYNVAQGEVGRISARVVDGTATSADIEKLAQASISQDMAARISKQYEANHTEAGGRKFANLSTWTDAGAKEAFGSAMQHEAMMTVMMPGIGNKPIFMDSNAGRLLMQYKSFVAAAHSNILLANLQQRDARTLAGVMTTFGTGVLATAWYKILAGQPMPDTPQNWIKEGIDRAAMTGWIGEANRSISGASHGSVSLDRLYGATGASSRRSNVDFLGQFMGPTADLVNKIGSMGVHTVEGNIGASDVHNARLMFPLQNLQGLRILFDKVGDSVDDSLGFPQRQAAGQMNR